jgi:hypothetical protein
MYKGGAFVFSFVINTNYPHDPPKVKCTQTVSLSPVSSDVQLNRSNLDLPPQRGPRGERMLEHPSRRLEARAEPQFGHGRPAIPVPGAKRRRSIEQR